MKKLILIIFFSTIFLNQSYATTLTQALSKAYKNNPKLNAERENLIISEEKINEAKSDFLPSITISGYVSDENTTKLTNRSGADVRSTDVKPSQESILIEQTLFQGLGGMANLEKNTIGLELSKLKLKKVEQEILLEAIEAYTNLVVNKKKVEINISNVDLLERQVENDKNRLERSEINLTDLAQSEASLAGANAKLIEARNHLITSKLNYEKTIGIINNHENLNEMYVFNYELPRSLASANKIAKKENPDLNIAILE
ncbi:MAG: TolC family protein, partial [Pelagibacteraceae bacterium]|nr:TolC family protein [Pelagibacteraceae bacterium]